MKNIAIIVTSLNSGGAERIAGLLSKKLMKKYNVYLFLLSTENIVYEYGGTIVDIGQAKPFYEDLILYYKELYSIDIAVSFLEIMNFANIRTKRGERVIISERCVQSLIEPAFEAQRYKIKRYYPFADDIVACSFGVKYDLIRNYDVNNNISVIYNFINQDAIKEKATDLIDPDVREFLDGKSFFVNVGRLDRQKNQIRLIEQFELFRKTNKEIKLLIIGSGDLLSELRTKISEKNLEEWVKIIPYISNPFVYIKHARALIVSSHYEGLPNVILEAMAIGCPIVSTDCLAGPRELLDDLYDYSEALEPCMIAKRGILVQDLISEDLLETGYLAQAMSIIAEDDSLCKLLCENQKEYMDKYSNDKIVDQWISVIENPNKSSTDIFDFDKNNIDKNKKLFIYGAGVIGTEYFKYLSSLYHFEGFIITKKQDNNSMYMGIPLYEIEEFCYSPDEVQIIIGVGDNIQDEVVRTLYKHGFKNIVFPYIKVDNLGGKYEF